MHKMDKPASCQGRKNQYMPEDYCFGCHDNQQYEAKPNYAVCRSCVYEYLSKFYCCQCKEGSKFVSIYTHAEAITEQNEEKTAKYYDAHYVSLHQPIETMQANMSPEAFQGFLRGNIIKYACRLGKKDDAEKEAQKICRYAEWLLQAVKGETIDPRKD